MSKRFGGRRDCTIMLEVCCVAAHNMQETRSRLMLSLLGFFSAGSRVDLDGKGMNRRGFVCLYGADSPLFRAIPTSGQPVHFDFSL